MRIGSVRIQNLRSFKGQTVTFDPYTCLFGTNGAGKSNVLCALNIFFGEDEQREPVPVNRHWKPFAPLQPDKSHPEPAQN